MDWIKYRKLAVIVIFLFVIVESYFFVIKKMLSEIEAKKNEIQEAMAIQENQQRRLGSLQKLREDFEEMDEVEGKIPLFLDKNKAVDFIREVEKLSEGANSQVSIEAVAADPPVKGKNAAKEGGESILGSVPSKDYLQFRIKTIGSFFGLIKFINKLENSTYYLDIVSIQINSNPEAGKSAKAEERGKANPFASAGKAGAAEKDEAPAEEEVVSSLSVLVYIKSQ